MRTCDAMMGCMKTTTQIVSEMAGVEALATACDECGGRELGHRPGCNCSASALPPAFGEHACACGRCEDCFVRSLS